MNLENLNLSVQTFNMLIRRGLQTCEALEAELDDPEKHEALRNHLGETCYAEVMTALNRTIYPRTSLDEIGLSPVLTSYARTVGIRTAEELAGSVSNPDSLWNPEKREEFCRHLKEHGYLETETSDSASDWDDTEFEELPETEIMSADYTKAVKLNQHIKAHAQIAQESLYEVCKGLKEMRDDKLYKELGYQNFEEYCEKEVGIKWRQAYNYISIVENFSQDSLQSIAKIGTTKLALLAKLDEPERQEIQQKVDIDSVSVKEMQKQIKELTKKNQEKQAEFDEFREGAKRRQDTLLTKLKEKAAEIQELQSHPAEVTVEDTSRIEELTAEVEDLKRQLAEQPAVQEMLPSDGESFSERRAEFNAYLKTLSDAMNHICAFIAKYQENHRIPEVEKTIEKYISAMKG